LEHVVLSASNINQGRSEIGDEVEVVVVPFQNGLACDIEIVNIPRRLRQVGHIARCEVPVRSILVVVPVAVCTHMFGVR
jgi:hypothetical protein